MRRACLGFIAGVLGVLIVHQVVWALLHLAGMMPPAYPMGAVGPLHVPLVADLAFWGGIWGLAFGLVLPRLPAAAAWLLGFGLGATAVLVGWFVVAPLHGAPLGYGFGRNAIVISLSLNLPWGIAVGLLSGALIGRRSARKLA